MKFLFSPVGRISRKQMWLLYILPLTGFWLIAFVIMVGLYGSYRGGYMMGQFMLVFFFLWAWPTIAVNIKRLHDIGWPAWRTWILVVLTGPMSLSALLVTVTIQMEHDLDRYRESGIDSFIDRQPLAASDFAIPIIMATIAVVIYIVWTIIALFVPGNRGENRFGPDPRDPYGSMVEAFE